MSDETKGTEVPNTEVAKATEVTSNMPEKTIPVDIYGETIDLPLSKAKAIINKRDTKTKEYNDLKGKIQVAESQAAQEAERAKLLELSRNQNIDGLKEEISREYKETIQKFEKKVFEGNIQAELGKLGIIPTALSDSTKLVLQDAKASLDGDDIKLNGQKADEYLKEWVKNKPHLMTAQVAQGTNAARTTKQLNVKQPVSGKQNLTQGLGKLFK